MKLGGLVGRGGVWVEFRVGPEAEVVQGSREDENIMDGYLDCGSVEEGGVHIDTSCPRKGREDKISMCIDSLELGYSDVTASADDIKAWLGFDVLEHAAKLLENEDYEPIVYDI